METVGETQQLKIVTSLKGQRSWGLAVIVVANN